MNLRAGLAGTIHKGSASFLRLNAHLLSPEASNERIGQKKAIPEASKEVSIDFTLYGLTAPLKEYRFDPVRRWRFDYAWPAHKFALEVEGGVWSGGRHTRGKGFLGDMEKYNAATLAGWQVFRCTPESVTSSNTLEILRKRLA